MFLIFLASKALYWTLYHADLSVFRNLAMDVEHIDTYTPGTIVNFKRSKGTVVLAKILGPSEHGAEYWSAHACQQAFFTPFSGSHALLFAFLLCVARPLHSKQGGEGTVTWGTFPRGCEGTVARRCFLYKGGRGPSYL